MIKMSSSNAKIYHQNSKPLGISYAEWSARWWQWLLTIPKCCSPAIDLSGKYATIGQSNSNVLFLCQTIENAKRMPRRKIRIRKGTCIFLPIINWVSNFYEHGKSDKELIKTANTKMDVIGNLEFFLNGVSVTGLDKYRYLSKFFTVDLPEDNILDLPAGKTSLVSDGYWVFTKPITANTGISTYGSCSSRLTKIGVYYDIKAI